MVVCVKAIFTIAYIILKATQNGHLILKVTIKTGFIQNTDFGQIAKFKIPFNLVQSDGPGPSWFH